MKKPIIITVYNRKFSDSMEDWPPESAILALGWFSKKLNEIPAQYADSARVVFCPAYTKQAADCRIRIYYTRMETEEESIAREQAEAAAADADIDLERRNSLAQIVAFQSKFDTVRR